MRTNHPVTKIQIVHRLLDKVAARFRHVKVPVVRRTLVRDVVLGVALRRPPCIAAVRTPNFWCGAGGRPQPSFRRSVAVEASEFRRIYDTHSRRLYNFIRWLCGSRQQSDDILQTVFLKVWQAPAVGGAGKGRGVRGLAHADRAQTLSLTSGGVRRGSPGTTTASRPPAQRRRGGRGAMRAAMPGGRRDRCRRRRAPSSICMSRPDTAMPKSDVYWGLSEGRVRVTAFRAFRRLRELLQER